MNTPEMLITIIITVLGSNLITLFTLKQKKRKESNDVEKSNIELATDAVNNMLDSVNKLMDKNKEYTEIILCKNDEISKMKGEKEDNGKRIELLEKRLNRLQNIFTQVIQIIESMPNNETTEKQIKSIQKLIKEAGCKE